MRAEWLLSCIEECVIGVDLDGTICYVNEAANARLAIPAMPLLGAPLDAALPAKSEDGQALGSTQLAELQRRGEPVVVCLPAADGGQQSLSLLVSPVRNEQAEAVGYSLMLTAVGQGAVEASAAEGRDTLTLLPGRRDFEKRLENLVNDALTSSRSHALLYVDIDQFKLINDTSGHVAGDNLVKLVAECLQTELFVGDILCRLGGDEFGVLLSNVDAFEAKAVANRLIKSIKRMNFLWGGISHRVAVSIGVVLIDERSGEREAVMSQADVALYAAKDNGRGRMHLYDEQDKKLSRLHNDMDWVHRINHALAKHDFFLVTETILPLSEEGAGIRFQELLVRMRFDGEVLRPGQFMPAAERFGLMPMIDRWVIKHFFDYLQRNSQVNQQAVLYSINISGQSLCEETFLEFVYRYLQRPGINPGIICFEITETVAITNFAVVTRFIQRVHQLGGRFALDDFGTGMSSFGYLQELPVDFVKIDGLFVHDMDNNPVHEAMVRSINDISHVLGKRTIAEFVEREATMDRLRELGVDFAQGHLHGLPQSLCDPPAPDAASDEVDG